MIRKRTVQTRTFQKTEKINVRLQIKTDACGTCLPFNSLQGKSIRQVSTLSEVSLSSLKKWSKAGCSDNKFGR